MIQLISGSSVHTRGEHMDHSSEEPAPLPLSGWAKEGTRQKGFGGGVTTNAPHTYPSILSHSFLRHYFLLRGFGLLLEKKTGFRKLVKVEASFFSGVSLAGNTSLGALRSLAGAHIATPFFFLPSFKTFVIAFLFDLYVFIYLF